MKDTVLHFSNWSVTTMADGRLVFVGADTNLVAIVDPADRHGVTALRFYRSGKPARPFFGLRSRREARSVAIRFVKGGAL